MEAIYIRHRRCIIWDGRYIIWDGRYDTRHRWHVGTTIYRRFRMELVVRITRIVWASMGLILLLVSNILRSQRSWRAFILRTLAWIKSWWQESRLTVSKNIPEQKITKINKKCEWYQLLTVKLKVASERRKYDAFTHREKNRSMKAEFNLLIRILFWICLQVRQ